VPQPGVDEALDIALASPPGLVVIADGADNPGGGAAGDSTFFLRRLVERSIAPAALGPLWDPLAVRIAFDAGVGATLMLRIGGKVSALSGAPLDAWCSVKALRHDMAMTGLTGTPMPLGDCALVETAGVQVVLTTLRNQAMETDAFSGLNCALAAQRIVVVKSSQHFHAAFAPLASAVIYSGAPGSVTADLKSLPYRHVRRPKWGL
jgi:microcystin degradation protein MlrC